MIPSIAVILTDAAKKILWVNEDFTKITGYVLPEVIGQHPGKLLQGPATEEEAVRQIRSGLRSNSPFRGEITNYRKNGEEYLCRLVIHPVFNNHQEVVNFIAFEVDGNKFSEAEVEVPLLELEQKYSSSSLKGTEELRLYQRLKELIERESLFLRSDLTLKDVADRLRTNTKYLSQVVNHTIGTNFQTFINQFRIEEVKSKMQEDQYKNLTLFGVALQCGFKNKSTFYKVFKDLTGQTPKQYIKEQSEKSLQYIKAQSEKSL